VSSKDVIIRDQKDNLLVAELANVVKACALGYFLIASEQNHWRSG
jgi:hypothetical protein